MPELPEVEIIRQTLRPNLVGRQVERAQFFRSDIFRVSEGLPDGDWGSWAAARTQGCYVTEVGRHGKVLSIMLDRTHGWLVRLGMSGVLTVGPPRAIQPHTHVRWLMSGNCELHFVDPRRFGRWIPLEANSPRKIFAELMGPDVLDPNLNLKRFVDRLENSRQGIKSRLLDQQRVAGLGNIYVDEALFQAGIRFDRPCASLSPQEWEHLYQAVHRVLGQAIENRGTTLSDYRDGFGVPGRNQLQLQVYARQGQVCPRCGELLCREVYRGRGTHFCPRCQR